MAVRNKGFIERMERMGLGILDPDVGLGAMATLLLQVGSASNTWSWQQALFVANIFIWDNAIRALPAVPHFLDGFARDRVVAEKAASLKRSALPAAPKPLAVAKAAKQGKRSRGTRLQPGSKAEPAVAVDVDKQAASVLAVILSTISNLGGSASAEQPFMESGIDSLGESAWLTSLAVASCWCPLWL